MTTVGIIGYGFVGKAVAQLGGCDEIDVAVHDPGVEEFSSEMCAVRAYAADIVFVCVPTPTKADGFLDTNIVSGVVREWEERNRSRIPERGVLVIKSTIPPGYTDNARDAFAIESIVHNPEFLREKTAMKDFVEADEIVVGGDEVSANKVIDLYRLYHGAVRAVNFRRTTPAIAELLKVARNSFYSVKISYMNELAELCVALGVGYDRFREVFVPEGENTRNVPIPADFTHVPGHDGLSGFGGKCFPKDSDGLAAVALHHGVSMPVLRASNESNKVRRPGEYK